MEWWLNGKRLSSAAEDGGLSYFWEMEPGIWTLEIKSGKESDTPAGVVSHHRVQFQVALPNPSGPAQGFSITPSNP